MEHNQIFYARFIFKKWLFTINTSFNVNLRFDFGFLPLSRT